MSEDKRIYRTAGTGVDYKFVTEIPAATTAYSDTITATALEESIPGSVAIRIRDNLSHA